MLMFATGLIQAQAVLLKVFFLIQYTSAGCGRGQLIFTNVRTFPPVE